jgi:TPR repeat protein
MICLRVRPCAEEGTALLEKAAGQGHAYAANTLGSIHRVWEEHTKAVPWHTKAAEAGLPKAMYNLAVMLDKGQGVAAPDYPAAADWYR